MFSHLQIDKKFWLLLGLAISTSLPAYCQEFDKSLDTVELNVLGRKYSDFSTESRLHQLEQTLGSEPKAENTSQQYRVDNIFKAQQLAVSDESKKTSIRLYNRGIDEANQGNTEAAIATYMEAIQVNPYLITAYNNLAHLQEKKHFYDKASETYRKALEMAPKEPLLHFNMAVVLEKQNKVTEAYDHYREYVKLSPAPSPQIVELVRNFDAKHLASKNSPDYYNLTSQESQGEKLIWPPGQMPISIYIHMSDPNQVVFLNDIYHDLDIWTQVTNGKLRFQEVGIPGPARIILSLRQGPIMDPNASIGHASFNSRSLDTEDPMRSLKVSITVNTGETDDELSLQNRREQVSKLVLHELGHAIGIWGHSKDPNDIMYTHPIVSQLSPRDVNTVHKLYGLR
jgi:predicted Zn-dependent protease